MAKAFRSLLTATLLAGQALPLVGSTALAQQGFPPPPPPPPPASGMGMGSGRQGPPDMRQGQMLLINGQPQRADWRLVGAPANPEAQLWLTLEVLQGQLGFRSESRSDGSLDLEWYGRPLKVPASAQRSLGDEVAVDVASLLRDLGVGVEIVSGSLSLSLPPPRLQQLRASRTGGPRRIVLDLEAPALMRRDGSTLNLDLRSDSDQARQLAALGLVGRPQGSSLALSLPTGSSAARVFTLGTPARVVIDLPDSGDTAASEPETPTLDPRLQGLLGRSLTWDRRIVALGGRSFRLNAVSLDPRTAPLELRPLRSSQAMEGLNLLPNLARRWDALVAINGGFFNRVRRLPLGALREQGRWLSGPILNRGVVAWEPGQMPRFGRLMLQEWLIDSQGGRWPLMVLNSGYVMQGMSRYTADWGPWYRAMSGNETAVLLRQGVVARRLDGDQLAAGVPLGGDDSLVVARGGVSLPWSEGEPLRLESRPSDPLGWAPNVIGGGPLLLQNGQVVLQGAAEGFSSAFLGQGAPRTVVASDERRLLLITLQGVGQEGPTLSETSQLLQQMGVRNALNLDGGSSTGLVMGGTQTVKGRGVTAAIHNGLGLVPRQGS
jgi:hypothetical protein